VSNLFGETGCRLKQILERKEEKVAKATKPEIGGYLMTYDEIENQQCSVCKNYGTEWVPAEPNSKVGFAIQTQGQVPVNGLRHPSEGDTNGWYLWCGPELSSAPDFFSPLHTRHLIERCPEAMKYLGLPPGYRFLIAGNHVDVWYDESLLNVSA
jgi:hypothetical protein